VKISKAHIHKQIDQKYNYEIPKKKKRETHKEIQNISINPEISKPSLYLLNLIVLIMINLATQPLKMISHSYILEERDKFTSNSRWRREGGCGRRRWQLRLVAKVSVLSSGLNCERRWRE
jgi:hypothetical protein